MRTTTVKKQGITCKLCYRTVLSSVKLSALSEVFSSLESASILGGNKAKTNAGRFSYWSAEPREIFEFRKTEEKPFEKLEQLLNKYKLSPDATKAKNSLPLELFCGGWVGYFSYDLNHYIEEIPENTIDDLNLPLIRLCFYDKAIGYDHIKNVFWLIALELSDDSQTAEQKLEELKEILSRAERINQLSIPDTDSSSIKPSRLKSNMSREYYFEVIKKIKRHILDGDIYQVNFSQRFESSFSGRSINLFHWENCHNPNGYAAYIGAEDFSIVSASPEMFITILGDTISTKPIKGTRPRLQGNHRKDIQKNLQNFKELQQSEKEKAELNMIIDLERNDVARICEPGTREVTQPRTIEEYPTVYHTVATVSGKLRGESSFSEVMRALFPGGSITGAPKISAMRIIAQTEPTARSIYTGAIGFIGIDGNVSLNIAIRTIIIKNKTAYAQTGGGIVADSNVRDEWNETLAKAAALIAGINSIQRSVDI